MLAVSYMGTKRHLAPTVVELAADCREGALLDLFSGMCAVGQEVAPDRQVWSNDLQQFAYLVAKCQFCNEVQAPDESVVESLLSGAFNTHLAKLVAEEHVKVSAEISAVEEENIEGLSKQFEDQIFLANRLKHGERSSYRLFLHRYAGVYFGLYQCIEIDSLRYAIDHVHMHQSIKEWCLVALCSAMAKCANTTGHFAQALHPKSSNIRKVVKQRKRSIWMEFLGAVGRLTEIGSSNWRKKNRVFQCDAEELLKELEPSVDIGVVYADPPYTADQYSRYYHLYETLILYDFPAARGRGLYRDNRAVSFYSYATKVKTGIDKLIGSTARLGADLILSYPSNGLLPNSREQISAMILEHFGHQPEIVPLFHSHSTMGASKGQAKHQVTELLYRAMK